MRTALLAFFITYPPLVFAQTSIPPGPPASGVPPRVRMMLADDSQVRGALLAESVTIETAYGPLTIPTREIVSITFGLRGDEAAAVKLVHQLGSKVHSKREEAGVKLKAMGRQALTSLREARKSSDMEISQRAGGIQQLIFANDPGAKDAPLLDTVIAREMAVVGKIKLDKLKVHSELLGELTVKLGDCRELLVANPGRREFALDAAKYGPDLSNWFDTGIELNAQSRLVINATGSVELWPHSPGQHVTAPKGFNAPGKGGQFMAGALIAKIGANGKAFYIGESFNAVVPDRGQLFLMVVPNAWNWPSAGEYKVTVAVGE